jgi:hypothetical protein
MFTYFLIVFISVTAVFAAPGTDHYRDIRLTGVSVTSSTIASTLNPVNGEIYLYYNNTNTLVRITEDSKTDTLSVLDFEKFQDRERKLIDTDPAGQLLYFWDTGVGRVYSYDLSSGELSRIDNSFHHKNQYNHAAFVDEQSRINAMGGYGLWTSKNYMTRFTMEDLEWNMPGTLQSYKPILASRFGHLFKYDGLFYYIVEDLHRCPHLSGCLSLQLSAQPLEKREYPYKPEKRFPFGHPIAPLVQAYRHVPAGP